MAAKMGNRNKEKAKFQRFCPLCKADGKEVETSVIQFAGQWSPVKGFFWVCSNDNTHLERT